MKDRIPSKPGRVLVETENGEEFYAKITMADEPTQEGDAPTKQNLLQDSTAEKLHLTDEATPDDAFSFLSQWHVLADYSPSTTAQTFIIPLMLNGESVDLATFNEVVFAFYYGKAEKGGRVNEMEIYAGSTFPSDNYTNLIADGVAIHTGSNSMSPRVTQARSPIIHFGSSVVIPAQEAGGALIEGEINSVAMRLKHTGSSTSRFAYFVAESKIMILAR